MDSFSYGKPARGGPGAARLALTLVGAVLAGAVVFAIFQTTKSGGEVVVRHVERDLQAADQAGDVEAQATLRTALVAVKLAFAESMSYASADADGLAGFEPSLRYTSGPSDGPGVVSVAADANGWAGAVMARSGTCFYLRADASGEFYGSGTPCTGQAARSASAPSW